MASPGNQSTPQVLLTGATGYVGGRLLKVFEQQGRPVRCLVRHPEFLHSRAGPSTQVVRGDVFEPDSLQHALRGIQTAYYLIHSMGLGRGFEERDRQAARYFAEVAREARVRRIIYLGGLGDSSRSLSPHLRSRQEVGAILRSSGVQTMEFRASIVIGSGSVSFEMIRALVERLPVMVTPRWVSMPAQPIAVTDLLMYLAQAADLPLEEHRIFEIGGADRISYAGLMREYARQRGLRCVMIPLAVVTPRLSSFWLGLVTPVYARIGRILVESLRHPTVVQDDGAAEVFAIHPQGVRAAIASALRYEDQEFAQTRWSDALSSAGNLQGWGGVRFGTRLANTQTAQVNVPPAVAFKPIRRLGGKAGWYYANWLWRVRGFIDLLVGGVGMRRGRRDPEMLRVGDVVDCWRVEAVEPDRRLRLVAEMRIPGRAWLEWEVEGDEASSTIQQTAIFDPVGLAGLAYWYLVYPAHRLIFRGVLRGIVKACARDQAGTRSQEGL